MVIKNRFNLIDEPWIPVVEAGKVSLKELFSNFKYRALGGNPIQKIALTKLLIAIAQAAYTPENDDDWRELGAEGLSEKCLSYLEKMHNRFWLYGENPFLQMPSISSADEKNFGAVLPNVANGNTTLLNESQIERPLTDADRALLLVSLMGFALGGTQTDNKIVLTAGYQGKMNTKGKVSMGKPGPFLGFIGLMHNFLMGGGLLETIWFNVFTKTQINEFSFYTEGLGVAPWEKMPEGEDCQTARLLKNSLMGRLVPLSRFCLLNEKSLHYSEGIKYRNYKEGGVDPSTTVCFSLKEPRVLWIDPEKRPWRSLTAILSFMSQNNSANYECLQIKFGLSRARSQSKILGVWSGGLKVSSNSGKYYVSGTDDFVDSSLLLPSKDLGTNWYEQLKLEMNELEGLSKILYRSTLNFFKSQKMKGVDQAKAATRLFWQLCEQKFQDLLVVCENAKKVKSMRKKTFSSCVYKAYETFCPKDTARQLDAWAKHRPNLNKYLT